MFLSCLNLPEGLGQDSKPLLTPVIRDTECRVFLFLILQNRIMGRREATDPVSLWSFTRWLKTAPAQRLARKRADITKQVGPDGALTQWAGTFLHLMHRGGTWRGVFLFLCGRDGKLAGWPLAHLRLACFSVSDSRVRQQTAVLHTPVLISPLF